MKKSKNTVLFATVLLAIVAFPLLSTAETRAPIRSIESFVLGTSGYQMNFQLAPDESILPGGATVGPAFVIPPPPSPPTACPPNAYCAEVETFVGDISVLNYYCPDLDQNPPTDPPVHCWDGVGPPLWVCNFNANIGVVECDWMYWLSFVGSNPFWDSCTEGQSVVTTPSCPVPPINGPNLLAPAVSASTSGDFEVLDPVDITTSLVCTDCDPVTNICDPLKCKTREFVERNIMEEYEGSCTYKYTTRTGQTVTKTITGTADCP